MVGQTADESVTTLTMGGSLAAFAGASLTPGRMAADEIAAVAGGWLASHRGRLAPVLWARQEHTRIGFVYGAEGPLAGGVHCVGVCDALITAVPEVALQVRTADCLPVALAGGGVAAMVHAGWRGLAADILGATVARIGVEFGVAGADLEAAIGVGIGPCHYQVGRDVMDGLRRLDATGAGWQAGDAVDLAAFARGRLRSLGVEDRRIVTLPGCTACLRSFHSHRRDGAEAGRQWSAIVLTGTAPGAEAACP